MNTLQNVVDIDLGATMASEVEQVEIAKPKLARMEAECKFLAVLLESGVEQWEGYRMALEAYRTEEGDDDA